MSLNPPFMLRLAIDVATEFSLPPSGLASSIPPVKFVAPSVSLCTWVYPPRVAIKFNCDAKFHAFSKKGVASLIP